MQTSKKICVVTGTRAEYGLLKELINKIKEDKEVRLQLIVTGMHLSPEFGLTYKQIEKDGFFIDEKIEILLSSDTDIGISKSMGLALISFSEAYQRLKPDMVILLGDRYEILAATIAAYTAKIPISHLCGGEITEGAYDDAYRHSITKMSYLHFTETALSSKRVIQLGEEPSRVYCYGSLGNDELSKIVYKNKKQLENEISLSLENYILIVYHAVTLEQKDPSVFFEGMIKYLLNNFTNYNLIVIKGNSDSYGRSINQKIDILEKENPNRIKSYFSIPRDLYLNLLKNANLMIGNSSSGICEAPSLETLNINIGDRQKGRERANTTIDCSSNIEDFTEVMQKYKKGEYNYLLSNIKNPYFGENVAEKILYTIKNKLNNEKIDLKKKFYVRGE
ncbi:UDP-N-acetylglucosamine 2-epimerase [Fusobacterium polymorphum]|jgi:UDP-N-acetyl-D-glucosamine 2-epimerase, UDP-hydrolysing|uniref:UDP-N-acetylglucosamine 2-epimerase (Hydrolyzing) n=1 Tax=Fusobacterium nucleatum subsp. polymorphum TaxID=76857 RepID=A0A2C6B1F9_FUSNP|nr:UDP-N-acetylglucosamine 2-epimerase [Fusobacterium polymorphum]PHH99427.1 UDP-N-acetylglucosamine 2-epimerase (hydrolyzing) [Fusobacterium polymorphum]